MTHKLSLVSKLLLLTVVTGAMVMACSKGDGEESDEGVTQTVTKDHIPPGSNRLALEQSPYLLQHAQNPVDWYPWGEEAFEKARTEDKPIFLSIGYSTCHWCHVMEHESFEDSTVAALMNDAFVNIKVDREERPDIDNIYMQVCQIMTRSGGWPLTIVMTPDRKPFFAATYIPKDARYGRTGLTTLIPEIKRVWTEDRPKLLNASTQITDHLQNYIDGRQPGPELGKIQLELAYEQLASRFDDTHGGFGTAPKFPTPHNLLFLLRYWKRTGDPNALAMVESTLGNMADGGIYDHVGFGFARYSTDARWFAPHFEKMLYDQALLIMAYTEAYLATGDPDYRRTAEEIIHYIERDMTDPLGGFYSAEDADSEGIEGKFYLWSQVQLREVLNADDAELVINLYGVTEHGNFAEEVDNANILFLKTPLSVFAAENSMSEKELRERLGSIRETLFTERKKRIPPYKDDKILTDWNGLMIAALAKAGRAFDEPEYTARAQRATDFVLTNMRDDDGELLHRYRQGSAGIESTVDDYAFFVWGLLELYESDFDVAHLEVALELNRELITHFWDDVKGGLYFTADDGEQLIVRMKEVYDGAIPSGNSVAMLNFLRLARMTGDTELESKAAAIGRAFSKEVSPAPAQFALMMLGVDFGVGPSYEVIVVGDPDDQATQAMTRALNNEFIPNKVVLVKPVVGEPRLQEIAAYTAPHQAIDGKPTVYVCRNYACELPTTDIEKMLELLAVEREE